VRQYERKLQFKWCHTYFFGEFSHTLATSSPDVVGHWIPAAYNCWRLAWYYETLVQVHSTVTVHPVWLMSASGELRKLCPVDWWRKLYTSIALYEQTPPLPSLLPSRANVRYEESRAPSDRLNNIRSDGIQKADDMVPTRTEDLFSPSSWNLSNITTARFTDIQLINFRGNASENEIFLFRHE
jgi:hypothetical protein